MERNYKKRIFFRDDDAAELNGNLKELIGIFISHNVPVHLSVIPARLTQECADYLARQLKESGGIVEIGQHGHLHEDHSFSTDKFGKYEFGRKRSYRQQRKDIIGGRKILKRYFRNRIDIFTPPWHGFDDTTLKILSQEGFLGLSADDRQGNDCDLYGLRYIPVSVHFNKRNNNGGWVTEKNVELLRKISRANGPCIGVLLHHKAFNGNADFRQLEELLSLLKNEKYVQFVPLSKGKMVVSGRPALQQEAVAYFLNYQFVPKPLAIIKHLANPILEKMNFNVTNPELIDQSKDIICEQIYSQLKQVVRTQLSKTKKPVGVLLSGGLDSAAILHVLREITDRKIYTLTGAYSPDAANLSSAQLLAQKYDTLHDQLIILPEDFLKIDALYRKGISRPIGDNGFLSTYLMLEKLKAKTGHIFSGDGADCLFCGLRMHHLNQVDRNAARHGRFDYAHYRFGEIFLNEQELDMAFEGRLNGLQLDEPLKEISDMIKTKDPVKKQIWLDLQFLVRNRVDYLVYAAKAAGVNMHLPYLNKEFVDFATRIPSEYLQGVSVRQKDFLRKAFEGKLPQEVLERRSEGFTPPFKSWYYRNRDFVLQKLAKARKLGISSKYILYLAQNYQHSDIYEKGMKIWLLVNLVSWYERQECCEAKPHPVNR